MELYLALTLIGLALGVTFHRLILLALKASLLIGLAGLFVKGLLEAKELNYQLALSPPLILASAALLGLLIGLTVAYAIIRHGIIHFYLKQQIEKQKQIAQSGRLW